MTTNKELYPLLATEEEMNNGTAPIVYYKGQAGYLCAYDAGLGFSFALKDNNDIIPELQAEELSILPIERKTPVVGRWGCNPITNKPYEFLYEFGYYTSYGCVVYKKGECNMQDAVVLKIEQIRVATPEDLKKYIWGN